MPEITECLWVRSSSPVTTKTRELLGRLLRSQGYRVLAAADSAETLALLRTEAWTWRCWT